MSGKTLSRRGIPSVFSIRTRGHDVEKFLEAFEKRWLRVSERAEEALRSVFEVTKGTTYKLGIIFGREFTDGKRSTENVFRAACKRGWLELPLEAVPYIRERISDRAIKQAGFTGLVFMHEPVPGSYNNSSLLCIGKRRDADFWWLCVEDGSPKHKWDAEIGFVFLVPSSKQKHLS